MVSSGLKIDELREVVNGISPTTVAAPPVPRDAPKVPPPPPPRPGNSDIGESENLLGFNYGGYAYSEENTTSSFAPVFIR